MQHIQKKFKTDQEKVYIGPQTGAPAAAPPPPPQDAAPTAAPSAELASNLMSANAVTYSATPSAPAMMAPMQGMGPPQDGYHQAPGYPGGYQHPGHYVLEKRTDGTLYPEAQWLQYHPEPIDISIQLPEASNVSDKCDGTRVSLDGLPPNTAIGTIRDRIAADTLGGGVGASRLKLRVEGKATTLRQTLAHWNLVSGDVITLLVS